jgi:hypothetical protein
MCGGRAEKGMNRGGMERGEVYLAEDQWHTAAKPLLLWKNNNSFGLLK